MKSPPIDWEDCIALGVAPSAEFRQSESALTVTPQPHRLTMRLLASAMASPPPEGDRLAYLRHVRDLLMGLTDWTQANDAPLTDEQRAAWATYRQALRNLPQAYSGDGPIPWPTAP